VRDVRDVFLFHYIYIYGRKIPMKSGIFAREGRCRVRNPTKKTGLVERPLIFVESLLIFMERPLIFVESLLVIVERPLIFVESLPVNVERPLIFVERLPGIVERPLVSMIK
jgi:hypothetical protein